MASDQHKAFILHDKSFLKSFISFPGSLEMDSPSQPVNNHHVHSHATVESKAHTSEYLSEPFFFNLFFNPSHLLCFLCVLTERKYSTPSHHTTEHVPEKKFKSEALLSTLTSDASKENTPGKKYARQHRTRECV